MSPKCNGWNFFCHSTQARLMVKSLPVLVGAGIGGLAMIAWRQSRVAAATAIFLVASGCASSQLNFNTLDLASTVDYLIIGQILSNLKKISERPYAIPSQVSIPTGTATTTNSITPSFTDPINNVATATHQVSQTASASPSIVTTAVNTATRSNMGLSVGGTDQWNQSYTIAPFQDPDQLRRLRALYRFGADKIDRKRFLCEYPFIQKSASAGSAASGTVTIPIPPTPGGKDTVTVTIGGSSPDKGGRPKAVYDRGGNCPGPIDPDPEFLKQPGCILCDTAAADIPGTHVLEVNRRLCNRWYAPSPDAIDIHIYAKPELYTRPIDPLDDDFACETKDPQARFYDFVLFVLEATLQGSGGSSSQSGGKGSSAPKGTPAIIIPQAPPPPPVLR